MSAPMSPRSWSCCRADISTPISRNSTSRPALRWSGSARICAAGAIQSCAEQACMMQSSVMVNMATDRNVARALRADVDEALSEDYGQPRSGENDGYLRRRLSHESEELHRRRYCRRMLYRNCSAAAEQRQRSNGQCQDLHAGFESQD